MSLGAAVLKLAERLADGSITDAEFDAAVAMIGEKGTGDAPPEPPPDGERSLTGISRKSYAPGRTEGADMDMGEDDLDGTGGTGEETPAPAAPPPVETHGSKAMRNLHKGLHALRKASAAEMGPLDDGDCKAHLAEHHSGMEKALKALSKAHSKMFKNVDPIPDDYEDDIVEKALSDEGEADGMSDEPLPLEGDGDLDQSNDPEGNPLDALDGPAVGERPPGEGEEEEEELSDEEAEFLKKSLPALERLAGLR